MISNNPRFLTITREDHKVYYGLLGIKDAILIDLEKNLYAINNWCGQLEFDSYRTKSLNWEIFEKNLDKYLVIENNKPKFTSIIGVLQDSIDQEEYDSVIIDRTNDQYYEGIKGWKKIITLHAIQ